MKITFLLPRGPYSALKLHVQNYLQCDFSFLRYAVRVFLGEISGCFLKDELVKLISSDRPDEVQLEAANWCAYIILGA